MIGLVSATVREASMVYRAWHLLWLAWLVWLVPTVQATQTADYRLFVDRSAFQLYVVTRSGERWRIVERFTIAVGRASLGERQKTREGDEMTPLGRYQLSLYDSPTYGWTYLLDYPTPQQRAAGYTGGLILIHAVDDRQVGQRATAGCVGVAASDFPPSASPETQGLQVPPSREGPRANRPW